MRLLRYSRGTVFYGNADCFTLDDYASHIHVLMKYQKATPEQVKEWHETDYWMKMDFDPIVMFVAIPTIIQVMVVGFMFGVMAINNLIF